MPRAMTRSTRSRMLVTAFLCFKMARARRLRIKRRSRAQRESSPSRDGTSSSTFLTAASSSSSLSTLESDDSSILHGSVSSFESSYDIESIDLDHSTDSSDSSSSSECGSFSTEWTMSDTESDKGAEADDEGDSGSESEEGTSDEELSSEAHRTGLASKVRRTIERLYARRYHKPRNQLPRGPAILPFVLSTLKEERPDHFREQLRIWPSTFDLLVAALSSDPVFSNNSQNAQLPVDYQVAIVLFRFGHYGNASSVQAVANWAGVGKGTVLLVTRRVMRAILRRPFKDAYVRLPNEAEKEAAKAWVEEHSCKAWRGGWCMVDGTLVPLYNRPFWFGESYFDRKCNYSMNIQVSRAP